MALESLNVSKFFNLNGAKRSFCGILFFSRLSHKCWTSGCLNGCQTFHAIGIIGDTFRLNSMYGKSECLWQKFSFDFYSSRNARRTMKRYTHTWHLFKRSVTFGKGIKISRPTHNERRKNEKKIGQQYGKRMERKNAQNVFLSA